LTSLFGPVLSLPKGSLIIPVRNDEGFFSGCVGSILMQDFNGDLEILVVDGGSTDRTREVVEELASKNGRRLRIVDNPKLNQPSGVNAGIKVAKGEWVVRMDAHAVYAPDYISHCIRVGEETGAANVGGSMRALPSRNTVIARAIAMSHRSKFGLGGAKFHGTAAEGEADTVWLGCFRKEVFDKVGLFNEALPRTEDIDFNSRLRQAGYKVWLSPSIRAWYFCRGTLRDLWRQNWSNGEGIVDTLPINRRAIGLRHLVPLLFVFSLLVLGVGGIYFRPFWLFLGVELVLYIGLLFVSSLKAVVSRTSYSDFPDDIIANFGIPVREENPKWKLFLCLPFVFLTLHLSYGLGSLFGLIRLPFARRQK
jgi:succinoglycan biosynthesis protein ExoA